jgi:glycogen operon protein
MPAFPEKLLPGKPFPLGAHWDGLGVNFAVFSAHAELIELCVFDSAGRREIARFELPDCTDEVFHGYLPQGRPGLVYGFRAHGPYQPEHGHRFNPNKLLLDPYAKKLVGSVHWSDTLFGYRIGAAREDLSFDRRDSAPAMPKAVVVDGTFHWGNDTAPCTPWEDTVIYEAHVRGLTMRHPEIAPHERGSFAALGDPWVIEHLQRLGVTAIELLPVQAFLQDRFLIARNLRNYWGYSTLAYFAPEPSYLAAADGSLHEIRQTIRRLHAGGIEVILDVVYNHTCEGSEMGPTLSWRGLDNLSYYQAVRGQPRRLVNDTGCGNTINITHPRVLQMVLDSLRHWAQAYRVDGFRFDLGTTLGREAHGFDPGSGFFDAIRQDPVLSRLKLISEPWDIGPGGYQLGRHPPGFAEWNDRYRDSVRRFWRGDAGQRPEIAARLLGSSDIFENFRRKTWASVNYIASHDGFTLEDIVSYSERHNEANGEDGQDGHGDNHSANYGAEGPSADAGIREARGLRKRAMLATLFLSHGTPMLLAGDEFGRTQQGNNNAYCQDNEISWVDWARGLDHGENEALANFTSRLIALRAAHPSLRSGRFMHGAAEVLPGIIDVAWFDEAGTVLNEAAWGDRAAQMLSLRRAVLNGGAADITLALLNAAEHDRDFIIPNPDLPWEVKLDSANPEAKTAKFIRGGSVRVAAHAVVFMAAKVKA